MKSLFNKDFWQADTLRTTWEYKLISFMVRVILAMTVIIYLVVTVPTVWPWAQMAHARSQPAERFESLITTAIASGDFNWAHRWLQARPRDEVAQHAAVVEKYISDVSPFLIGAVVRDKRENATIEDTRFWLMYMQYRMRYDIVRCGQAGLVNKYNELQTLVSAMQETPDELAATRNDPHITAALMQQVLDYDALHPARNTPALVCKTLTPLLHSRTHAMAPPETWASLRHTLRLVTENAINDMKATNAPQPAAAP